MAFLFRKKPKKKKLQKEQHHAGAYRGGVAVEHSVNLLISSQTDSYKKKQAKQAARMDQKRRLGYVLKTPSERALGARHQGSMVRLLHPRTPTLRTLCTHT
jgi:hypothetical protein